jgi:hypothetical protein
LLALAFSRSLVLIAAAEAAFGFTIITGNSEHIYPRDSATAGRPRA